MPFQVTWESHPNTLGADDHVAVLTDGTNRLEVSPAIGFNAYRWQVAGHELLYVNPQFFTELRPTRGGFPILFPFPNRIRAGTFTWDGKTYQLPLGDPAKRNAIHGFVFNRAWRIVDQGANDKEAWITGEFHGSKDAPETLTLWPADYRLRVTYRLLDHVLQVEAVADNPDSKPLPFGLGYHPYFAIAPFGGPQTLVTATAQKYWALTDNLPTGQILDVDETSDQHRDLRVGRNYESLKLDDVLTCLQAIVRKLDDGLAMVGAVQHPAGERILTLWMDTDFRELVAFTPPHRDAICLEPYTCTTDAINLQQRGVNAGLRVLAPGERWSGIVEMHLSSS